MVSILWGSWWDEARMVEDAGDCISARGDLRLMRPSGMLPT